MIEWITEPLQLPFYERGLLACLVIGFANGFFSAFVVLRRSALMVSALSHTLLPGIALGILVAGALSSVSAFLGALFAALTVGLSAFAVSRSSRIDQSTALAILYTTAFSGGVVLLTHLSVPQQLEDWLFGNIIAITDTDLWVVFGISSAVLLSVTALMRPVLLTLFQPAVAAAQGVPVRALGYLLLTFLILLMISSLQAVGCVLAIGLLVTPAATVYLFTDRTSALFWGGGFLGAFGASAALILSYWLNLQAGPAIVLLLGSLFVVAYLGSPRYGLLRRLVSPAARNTGSTGA